MIRPPRTKAPIWVSWQAPSLLRAWGERPWHLHLPPSCLGRELPPVLPWRCPTSIRLVYETRPGWWLNHPTLKHMRKSQSSISNTEKSLASPLVSIISQVLRCQKAVSVRLLNRSLHIETKQHLKHLVNGTRRWRRWFQTMVYMSWC